VNRELKKISEVIPDCIIDLRYKSPNNVTGMSLYDNDMPALLSAFVLEKLAEAAQLFRQKGLRLVIWDAYRPPSVQKHLRKVSTEEKYVSKISNHSRGIAVDMTLADKHGELLDMGTDFDNFSKLAGDGSGINNEQLANRDILHSTMTSIGFVQNPYEWWHYAYPTSVELEPLEWASDES